VLEKGQNPFDEGANEQNIGEMDKARKKALVDVVDNGLANNAAWEKALTPAFIALATISMQKGGPFARLAAQEERARVENELRTSNYELNRDKATVQKNFKLAEPLVFDLDGDGQIARGRAFAHCS
jgi:hypothetical protein